MPACESNLVSRSNRKATVAKTVLIGWPRSCDHMPSLVGDRGPVLQVPGWALTRMHMYHWLLHCLSVGFSVPIDRKRKVLYPHMLNFSMLQQLLSTFLSSSP